MKNYLLCRLPFSRQEEDLSALQWRRANLWFQFSALDRYLFLVQISFNMDIFQLLLAPYISFTTLKYSSVPLPYLLVLMIYVFHFLCSFKLTIVSHFLFCCNIAIVRCL